MRNYNVKTIDDVSFSGKEFPGSFRFKSIELVTPNKTYDITDSVAELFFTEGFEQTFIMGECRVHDIEGSILHKDLYGDENIKISLTDGTFNVDKEYQCYKIGRRDRRNPQSEMFTIYFMNADAFKAQSNRISKSYINMKAEDIIKDMFDFYADTKLDESNFYYGESADDLCCIIPNWSISRAVNFIASKAISVDTDLQSNNYVFFETFDGIYNFFPTEGFLDAVRNKPYATLIFDPLRKKQNDSVSFDPTTKDRSVSIEDFKVNRNSDHLMNIMSGMYSNRVSVVDVSMKEIVDIEYDYLESFNDSDNKHLRLPNSVRANPLIRENAGITKNPQAAWLPIFSSKGLFTEQKDSEDRIAQMYHKKTSKNVSLENYSITATLPGHMGFMTGQIVTLNIPDATRADFRANGDGALDTKLSGNYLISSVTRVFTNKKFEVVLELVKDCT